MIDKEVKKILKDVGLSNPEIKIYIAGLQTGPVLVSFLAKKTGVTRQHVYDILRLLENKGLVGTTGTNYNKRFIMAPPEKLKNYLERKKRKIEKLETKIESLSEKIKLLGITDKFVPEVKFYEGEEGIKGIFVSLA